MKAPAIRRVRDRLQVGTPFRVLIRNEVDVVLEIGGKELPAMSPDTAIDMAIGLKHAGKLVKERQGLPKRVHGIADLTDAVADEREMQRTRDGTAIFGRAKRNA